MTTLTSPDGQGTLLLDTDPTAPAGNPERFLSRWRLTGAGLCNVWRYGDLALDTPSGRLLMRGANGTGKTTALEALCPYLLDLNASRLAAGKSRPTTLASLMREGADGKRRTGYAWLTFAAPQGDGHPHAEQSWGVRLQYGPSSSPQVKVVPFTVPDRPLTDLDLHGPGREALRLEEFTAAVEQAGGTVFPSPEEYVTHLSLQLWRGTADDVDRLTGRLRAVRNPSLLGDVSPSAAAEALRASLPTVDPAVVQATADALAASDETRDAFDRDRAASDVLADFAAVWTGHATDVLTRQHQVAFTAQQDLTAARTELGRLSVQHQAAATALEQVEEQIGLTRTEVKRAQGQVQALKESDAYRGALQLSQLEDTLTAQKGTADAQVENWLERTTAANRTGAHLRNTLEGLSEEVEDVTGQAGQVDPAALPETPLLAWRDIPRAVLRVGEHVADPGPGLSLSADTPVVSATATAWQELGRQHRARAEQAGLLLGEHQRAVAGAEKAADSAGEAAERARQRHEELSQRLHQRTVTAQQTVGVAVDAVTAWTVQHPDLVTAEPLTHDEGLSGEGITSEGLAFWNDEQASTLRECEPSQALSLLEQFAGQVIDSAGQRAGAARSAADLADQAARDLLADAGKRRGEAGELRSGGLLPLPRPHWSGSADDAHALGSALTWNQDERDDLDPALQAALEVAMADSGLLSAHLVADGATTGTWQVSAAADVVHPNLGLYLSVDPAHPLAATAERVLRRVKVAATAPAFAGELVIGEDGSFTAGPLRGDRLAAAGSERLAPPAASFVGERQRRQAAAARAAVLEAEADDLELAAADQAGHGRELRAQATQVLAAARSVPSREPLRRVEALRAGTAEECATAEGTSAQAATAAQAARDAFRDAQQTWAAHARSLGLPPTVEELTEAQSDGRQAAQTLGRCAQTLTRLAARITSLSREVEHHTTVAAQLHVLREQAQQAVGKAAETRARIQQLLAVADADIHTIHAKLETAQANHVHLTNELETLDGQRTQRARAEATLDAQVAQARDLHAQLGPAADVALARLRELLSIGGVVAALSGFTEHAEPAGAADGQAVDPGAAGSHATCSSRALDSSPDTARWVGAPCRSGTTPPAPSSPVCGPSTTASRASSSTPSC